MAHSEAPRDLADRPSAELSPERLRALLDYSWDILSLLDREGHLLYNSPAAQRLHGFTAEEMAERNTFDFIHPEDRGRVGEAMGASLAHPGRPVWVQYRYARKEGGWMWMEAVAVNLLDQPEVRAIVANSRDISDRVEAQTAVLALRESEARYRALFTHMTQGFALCRMDFQGATPVDWTYLEVNPAFSALTGLEGVVGRKVSEVIPGIREADPELFERYGRVVRTGIPAQFETYVSALRMWFSIAVYRPMADHFVAVFEVIDARKQAEEARLQLERQLHRTQKMESLGSLAGGMAHDMNNVLGSILGLASLHEELEPEGSPARKAFATIAKACQRGGGLVRRLLDFARQDLSEVKVVDLNSLIQEEAALLERTTLAQVRCVLDLDPGLRPIQGDASALTHALMNLCVNAVDAMPEGGTLTLRTRNEGTEGVEVQVVDTGQGMPREVLDKALDPFFTTKPQGKGTGLGLALVYGAMKAHQGTVALRSEPGRGTTVTLRFPACPVPTEEDRAREGEGSRPGDRSLAVLLVDDDELIQAAMESMIERLGHRPVVVPSGEAALAQVEAGLQPDVVILDLNMPGLGGAGTLPRLRSLLPEVPVLLATGRSDQRAMDLVQAHPGVSLLSKPFTLTELSAQLEAAAPRG